MGRFAPLIPAGCPLPVPAGAPAPGADPSAAGAYPRRSVIATYTTVLVVCAASLMIGQAAISLCGGRAGRGSRPGPDWRFSARSAADGPAPRRGDGPGDRGPARLRGIRPLSVPRPARRWPRGPCRRRPGGGPGAARGLGPVRRRGPLRHPRNQLQPGYVAAPPCRRPPRPRRRLAVAGSGLPAGAALGRRRPQRGPRYRHRPGLQRIHRRRRGPRPDRPRRPRGLLARPPVDRRPPRRPSLHGRLLLRPGRLQEDDPGAVHPRLRDRTAGAPRPRRAGRLGGLAAGGGAAGADRGRQRLCLQLPRPHLAGGAAAYRLGQR